MRKILLIAICGIILSNIAFAQEMNDAVLIKASESNINIKMGYAAPAFYDLDKDGLQDLFVGDLWGSIYFFKNIGTKANPKYEEAKTIEVNGKKKIINNW